MKASVGRIVHVNMDPGANNSQEFSPGIIVAVWNDGTGDEAALVNIKVFPDSDQAAIWYTSIKLYDTRGVAETARQNAGLPLTGIYAWWPERD